MPSDRCGEQISLEQNPDLLPPRISKPHDGLFGGPLGIGRIFDDIS